MRILPFCIFCITFTFHHALYSYSELENKWEAQLAVLHDRTLHTKNLYQDLLKEMEVVRRHNIFLDYNGKGQFQKVSDLIIHLESAHAMIQDNLLPFLNNLESLQNRAVIEEEAALIMAYKGYMSDNMIESQKAYSSIAKSLNTLSLYPEEHLHMNEFFIAWTLANRELLRTAQSYEVILRNYHDEFNYFHGINEWWSSNLATWSSGATLLLTGLTCYLLYKQYNQHGLLIQAVQLLRSAATPPPPGLEGARRRSLGDVLAQFAGLNAAS